MAGQYPVLASKNYVATHADLQGNEERLQDSEARFRAFVTASSDVVYRMSPDWSEMWQLGGRAFLPATESPTTAWIDTYIPRDERPRVSEAIDRAIGAKGVFELEHRVLGADGTVHWVFSRAIPILDEAGEIAEWFGAATDVTSRVKADQSFTRLFQASPAPFLVVKPDAPRFTITEVNDAYLAATMRTRETVVGRGIFEAYPGNSHNPASSGVSALRASLERVLVSRQPDTLPGLKYDIARPDGTFEERWWDPVNSPVLDEDGRVEAIIHNANDVTEERNAEAALRTSEERLRQFGDASQDVLWIRDANTLDWTYLTPAFETIYGLDREEALSGDNYRNWQELIVSEDRAHAAASIERVSRGEQVVFEYRIKRPLDGKIRWLRDTDFPMRGADGQVRHIGGVGHDITAMKEAEEALAAAEQRQRLLLEGIPQLVWRAVDDGQWTWASPQWTEYTGQSENESLGRGWLETLHPGDKDAALSAWDQAQANGLFQVNCRIRHAVSGDYRWFQSRGISIRQADGSVVEWLGTSTDVDDQVRAREFLTQAGRELEQRVAERTGELQQALNKLQQEVSDHEQAEERLRQSEKLKAIGQLTGGIAHDFNNMLQGITSALALVRRRLEQGRITDAKAYIGPAEKAATRAGALTHRLLAFSRQQPLAPELVNLSQISQNMEDMIRRTVGPAVQVELKSADGHWLVLCDPNQLESALLNLCVNARDAMPEGGWLTISTEERVLVAGEMGGFEELQPGRYAAVAVTDTGGGMPPDVLARVFEPFYTTKPVGQGTGLGLSQIYGFMRQSGGLVQIETMVGTGTTVRLCLPFHEMNPDEQLAPPTTGKTLLLVEDEHDVRGMLADQLRDLGYRILEADTAAAALRVFSTGVQVDLLVTDVGLRGGVNGRQLADMAREQTKSLPVVFITGFAGGETLRGEDVIRKPFETMTLAGLIKERLIPVS